MTGPVARERRRAAKPVRRWRRRLALATLAVVGAYLVSVLAGLSSSWPFDVVVNLGFTPEHPELAVPDDGRRRVVVLQHGLLRSPLSLGRLERTLRRHGYEVLNPGYPSTRGTIEEHAARLAKAIEARVKEGPIDEISFVGHSMGGLVIEEYLRSPDAVEPKACVYIATPHRGAILADLRKRWFLFDWVMGRKAARQLSPGDPLHGRPIRYLDRTAVIVGDVGEGNRSIPGRDDGTVGVEEASLPGVPRKILPFGHTRIAVDPSTAVHVLSFLRRGLLD